MKRNKILATLLLVIFTIIGLASCSSFDDNQYDNMASVTFKLNGGTFKNSEHDVVYYYDLAEGTSCKVKVPGNQPDGSDITYAKKQIEGWYIDEEYTKPWDFDKDLLHANEHITIYIKWKSMFTYQFALNYIDPVTNEKVFLNNVKANEQTFKLSLDSGTINKIDEAVENNNYTCTYEFFDVQGQALSSTFSGSEYDVDIECEQKEESVTCEVYVKVIEGTWTIAKTHNDLATIKSGDKIYIRNDIDCQGNPIFNSSSALVSDVDGVTIEGNNHTVSNFVVDYSYDTKIGATIENKVGYVSLFKNLNNSIIKNVTFDNAICHVVDNNPGAKVLNELYIAPLAYMAKNTVIENVIIKVDYALTGKKYDEDSIVIADSNYSDNHIGIGIATGCTIGDNSTIIYINTEE